MLSRGTTSDPVRDTSPARGIAFSQTPLGIITFVTAASVAVFAITVALWLKHRTKEDTARRDDERARMEVALAEARTREDAANLERAQLEASLHATREAAEAQRAALQQLSSELGDRLLQQQASAFQATTAALERRASSESEAIRAAYEAATAERNERLHMELQPLHETLQRVADTTVATDTRSASEFTRLVTLVLGLNDEQRAHREETRKLQDTLRVSQVRGRFGEWTLQRALEAAGLQEGVHYEVQPAMQDDEGMFRPDVVLHLPNARSVIIDSKAPLEHLLAAHHATTQREKNELLDRHAKSLRTHVDQLANKEYAPRVAGTMPARMLLEGVLLFVPADGVLEVAHRRDPELLGHAARRRVHLVSPSSLLIVLSAVEQLWRQDGRDQRAADIEQLGTDLLERVGTVLRHVARLEGDLTKSVKAYNALVRSLDVRLMPVVRKLESAGVQSRKRIPAITQIDNIPRALRSAADLRMDSTPSTDSDTSVGDNDTPAAA